MALRGTESDELKGSGVEIGVKKCFYRKTEKTDFKIYAMTLNKQRVFSSFVQDRDRIYNYISRLVLDRVSFEDSCLRVILTGDKSKTRPGIREIARALRLTVPGAHYALKPLVKAGIVLVEGAHRNTKYQLK